MRRISGIVKALTTTALICVSASAFAALNYSTTNSFNAWHAWNPPPAPSPGGGKGYGGQEVGASFTVVDGYGALDLNGNGRFDLWSIEWPIPNLNTGLVFSAWVKMKSPQSSNSVFFSHYQNWNMTLSYATNTGFSYINQSNTIGTTTGFTSFISDTNWHHVMFCDPNNGNSANALLWIDGYPQTNRWAGAPLTTFRPSFGVRVGAFTDSTFGMRCYLDSWAFRYGTADTALAQQIYTQGRR